MVDDEWNYEPVPSSAQRLYRMCWQLETWLRTIVYVELRAARVDWESPIQKHVNDWPPRSLSSDKRLHHMATPHQAALSYLTFGQLWSVIADRDIWPLFEPYCPPKNNTDARIEEVKAIRNRVAHFREPHHNDVDRLALFIRDLDPGIRRFCSRYTTGKVPKDAPDDLVSSELAADWEHDGYGIELMRPNGWLYAPEPHRMHPLMNAGLAMLTHKKYEQGSTAGVVYALNIHGKQDRLDTVGFFESTRNLHGHIIHIMLSRMSNELTVTIPAIHGPTETADLISKFLQAGLNCSRGSSWRPVIRDQLEWPEYVLWPDHLLTFYDDDIKQPILDTD